MSETITLPYSEMVSFLEAIGEDTRLRLVSLLSEAELTVTELTQILGQSQPRISRHLKLLNEAGVIERHREGAFALFRLNRHEPFHALSQHILETLKADCPLRGGDALRLKTVRNEREEQAQNYFARHASDWDKIRAMHVPEAEVEAAVLELANRARIETFLDLGTGTGKMLQLLSPLASRAIGLDSNPAMLAVARVNMEKAGVKNLQLRQGDLNALPPDLGQFDLILLHQVLHYMEDPQRIVSEAARFLSPGGRLIIVDLAPHQLETLREKHAHRRLGFAREEIAEMLDIAALDLTEERNLAPQAGSSASLTVSLFMARDRRRLGDFPEATTTTAALSNHSIPRVRVIA